MKFRIMASMAMLYAYWLGLLEWVIINDQDRRMVLITGQDGKNPYQ